MKTLLMGLGIGLLLWASCTKPLDTTDESETFRHKLLQANNAFSIKLLQHVHQANDSGNVVVSPLSLSAALSIVANGAEGTTREAIVNTIELQGLSLADVNQTYKILLDELPASDPAVEWSFANSIWCRNGVEIKTAFEQINQLYYQITLQQLDLTDPGSIEIINNWMSNATDGNIQDVIDQLTAGQGLYLVNSLWFKARFKQSFDSTLTTQQPFYPVNGQSIPVNMMNGRGMRYGYYADNEVKIADLPYENGTFSFTIVMPSDASNIDQLVSKLSVSRWDVWMNGLNYETSPNLFLPKFDMEYNSFLKPLLVDLGMGIAFNDGADFSNITDAALNIADLRHKTSLAISEEGIMTADNNTIVTSNTFSVNKPFLIAVREKETGRLLIIGKVMNPTL